MKIIVISVFISSAAIANCSKYGPCIEIRDLNEDKFRPITKMNFSERPQEEDINLIDYARGFIGTPYLYGGETEEGIDCSAFIQQIFREFGISLPRTSREQFSDNRMITVSVNELRPNDLLFFRSVHGDEIDHVALYIGDGRMIHSSKMENGVQITDFKFSKFWSTRFDSAKRLQKDNL